MLYAQLGKLAGRDVMVGLHKWQTFFPFFCKTPATQEASKYGMSVRVGRSEGECTYSKQVVCIRLPWPCLLGGVLIHPENKLLSYKRMTAFGTSQMLPFMC